MIRLTNTIKIAYWAWKNPRTLNPAIFKMLCDIFALIFKVATENRHMMTKIACVVPEEDDLQIATIWVGAGAASSPTSRIAELLKENAELKAQLAEKI